MEQRSEIFCTFSLSLDLDLLWNFLVRRQGEDEATWRLHMLLRTLKAINVINRNNHAFIFTR